MPTPMSIIVGNTSYGILKHVKKNRMDIEDGRCHLARASTNIWVERINTGRFRQLFTHIDAGTSDKDVGHI